MRTRKFTDVQIVAALPQAGGGTPVTDVCHRPGATRTTFHRWREESQGVSSVASREMKLAARREPDAQNARRGAEVGRAAPAGQRGKATSETVWEGTYGSGRLGRAQGRVYLPGMSARTLRATGAPSSPGTSTRAAGA